MSTRDSQGMPALVDKREGAVPFATGKRAHRFSMSGPSFLLRLEGLVVLALSLLFYGVEGGSWQHWVLYALLLFVPDLSMLGYLAGNRVGAFCYNLVHTYVLPLALLTIGLLSKNTLLVLLALIWLSHIGMDRVQGYGLKYITAFKDTHFSKI